MIWVSPAYAHLVLELFERDLHASVFLVDQFEDFLDFVERNFEVRSVGLLVEEIEVWLDRGLLKKPESLSAFSELAFLMAEIFLLFIAEDFVVTWSMNSFTLLMLFWLITAISLMFSVAMSISFRPGLLDLFTLKAFLLPAELCIM